MNRLLISLLMLMASLLPAVGQQSITISDILAGGRKTFPLAGRDSLIRENTELQIKNLNNKYLPSLSLEGKATWQSDVTTITLPIPGVSFPEFPQDQYKISADIRQLVFDGGLTKSAKEAETLKAALQNSQLATAYIPLFHQLNALFHGILLMNENEKSLQGYQTRLIDQERILNQLTINGMAKSSQLDEIKIEQLKIQQNLEEIEFNRKDALEALKILSGVPCQANQLTISLPGPSAQTSNLLRPELQLFDTQVKLNILQSQMQSQQQLPKVAAFAQLGYGKPGLNMFATEFKEYAIVGINLSWTIYDWGETRNNKRKFSLESSKTEQDRALFVQNTQIKINSYQNQQEKIQILLESQQNLIELRKTIVSDKEKQVKEGNLLQKSYLDDLNLLIIDEIKLNELTIRLHQNKIDEEIENGQIN